MREHKAVDVSVSFGDKTATFVRSGQSKKVICNILGEEIHPETRKRTIWLDRLTHRGSCESIRHEGPEGEIKFSAAGAISTVLTEI